MKVASALEGLIFIPGLAFSFGKHSQLPISSDFSIIRYSQSDNALI